MSEIVTASHDAMSRKSPDALADLYAEDGLHEFPFGGLPPYQGGPPGLVPTGVAVGAGGTVYVSSDIRNALYKLTPPAP